MAIVLYALMWAFSIISGFFAAHGITALLNGDIGHGVQDLVAAAIGVFVVWALAMFGSEEI